MKGIQIIIECSLKIMISLYHYSSRKRTPTPLSLSGFPSPGLGFFLSSGLSLSLDAILLLQGQRASSSRSHLPCQVDPCCCTSMQDSSVVPLLCLAGQGDRLGQSFQEVWVNIYVTGPSRGLVPYIYNPSSNG